MTETSKRLTLIAENFN